MLARFNVSGSVGTVTVRRVTKQSVVSHLTLIHAATLLTISIHTVVITWYLVLYILLPPWYTRDQGYTVCY